jgi:hypothetical protein
MLSIRLFKNRLLSSRLLENNMLNIVFKNEDLKMVLFRSMIDEATKERDNLLSFIICLLTSLYCQCG